MEVIGINIRKGTSLALYPLALNFLNLVYILRDLAYRLSSIITLCNFYEVLYYMRTKDIELVDKSTGEVVEELAMLVPRRKQNGFNKEWAAMGQLSFQTIAESDDLRGQDYRIMFFLMSILDWNNMLIVSQRKVAKHLGISPVNVSQSIKKLVNLEILEKGKMVGRSYTYKLNPNIAWKGSAKEHHKAIDDYNSSLAQRKRKANMEVIK